MTPFAHDDRVLLVDQRGRQYLFRLQIGGSYHTHSGALAHDVLIGAEEGTRVETANGMVLIAFRPRFADYALKMRRGAQVVYPNTFRPQINSIANEYQRGEVGQRLLRKLWPDELLYISKTSWISTKEEGAKLLVPNYAQQRFYRDVIQRRRAEAVPIRGIVLKARQLGFSTFIQAWQYEQCARNAHRNSLTISYDADSTTVMFQKARFIHQRQWFPMPLSRKAREGIEMEEPHGSNFYTETAGNERAGRSYTVHHLHCSEVPMWMDDGEVLNAAHQSVPASNTHSSIFHESTAKGAVGSFYDLWDKATKSESNFIPLFARGSGIQATRSGSATTMRRTCSCAPSSRRTRST